MIERSPCTRYSSKMGTLIAIQPLFQPGEVAVITPTLQVRKPRHRQLKQLTQSDIVGCSQELGPGSLAAPGPGQRSRSPYPMSISFTDATLRTEFPARLDGKTSREGRLHVKRNVVFQDPEYSHQKNLVASK